jgi:hypothetical protein
MAEWAKEFADFRFADFKKRFACPLLITVQYPPPPRSKDINWYEAIIYLIKSISTKNYAGKACPSYTLSTILRWLSIHINEFSLHWANDKTKHNIFKWDQKQHLPKIILYCFCVCSLHKKKSRENNRKFTKMLLRGLKKVWFKQNRLNYLISTYALLKRVGQEVSRVRTYSPYYKLSAQAETGSERPATCKHKETVAENPALYAQRKN